MGRKPKRPELAEATDLTGGGAYQDIVVPPRKEGDPTGQSAQLQAQADAIATPVKDGITAPSGVAPQAMPRPINLGAPTNKPFEPNTSGIPLGAGPNGPEGIPTDTLMNFLTVAKEITKDPIFDELMLEDFLDEDALEPNPQNFFGI